MRGTIVDVDFEEGQTWIEQKVKNMRTPKHAVGGSNGSFVCATGRRIIIYTELDNDTRTIIKDDITDLIKEETGWKRLTDKKIELIKNELTGGEVEVTFRGEGRIMNGLKEIVEELR